MASPPCSRSQSPMIMIAESLVERARLSCCRRSQRSAVTHPGPFLSLLLLTERTTPHHEKQEAGEQICQNNRSTVPSDWPEAQPLPPPSGLLPGRKHQLQGRVGRVLWLGPPNLLGSGGQGAGEKNPCLLSSHCASVCS